MAKPRQRTYYAVGSAGVVELTGHKDKRGQLRYRLFGKLCTLPARTFWATRQRAQEEYDFRQQLANLRCSPDWDGPALKG